MSSWQVVLTLSGVAAVHELGLTLRRLLTLRYARFVATSCQDCGVAALNRIDLLMDPTRESIGLSRPPLLRRFHDHVHRERLTDGHHELEGQTHHTGAE